MLAKRLCVVLLLVLVALSGVQAVDRWLYLIRHGNSQWNAAQANDKLKILVDYAKHKLKGKMHEAELADAALTKDGVMDALKICKAVFAGAKRQQCIDLGNEIEGNGDWAPLHNVLHSQADEPHKTHAQILKGEALTAENRRAVTHVASNLVRAIDTLFFSLFPAINTIFGGAAVAEPVEEEGAFSIRKVLTTSFIQEVGKGYDGSMHEVRMRNCPGAAAADTMDLACVTERHNLQVVSLKELGAIMSNFVDGGIHQRFYAKNLVAEPSDDSFFQFQRPVSGLKRNNKEVQKEMFDAFIDLIDNQIPADSKYVVVAGHSHYFAHFLKYKSTPENVKCQKFAKLMQDNGAIWRVQLSNGVITDCSIVYGRFKNRDERDLRDAARTYMDADMPIMLEQNLQDLESDLAQLLNEY